MNILVIPIYRFGIIYEILSIIWNLKKVIFFLSCIIQTCIFKFALYLVILKRTCGICLKTCLELAKSNLLWWNLVIIWSLESCLSSWISTHIGLGNLGNNLNSVRLLLLGHHQNHQKFEKRHLRVAFLVLFLDFSWLYLCGLWIFWSTNGDPICGSSKLQSEIIFW